VAEGLTVTATVSFTVPQVLAVAERHRLGIARARARNLTPGRCFAVLMVGRLDDYLREVAADARIELQPGDVEQAGIAVAKRSYEIFQQRKYDAVLLIAALRGDYHLTELAGADLVMSIFPSRQEPLLSENLPCQTRIERPVAAEVIARLSRLGEFVRAYKPEGMRPEEFLTYGVSQRTLAQFADAGWRLMETLKKEEVL
jgi:transaldolase